MAVVHVVGAGLAGLAAAIRLSERQLPVRLYEAAQQAGGRCRSYHDRALGRVIDNGNHLLLSGNRAALDYLAAIGSQRQPARAAARRASRSSIWPAASAGWCGRTGAGCRSGSRCRRAASPGPGSATISAPGAWRAPAPRTRSPAASPRKARSGAASGTRSRARSSTPRRSRARRGCCGRRSGTASPGAAPAAGR